MLVAEGPNVDARDGVDEGSKGVLDGGRRVTDAVIVGCAVIVGSICSIGTHADSQNIISESKVINFLKTELVNHIGFIGLIPSP